MRLRGGALASAGVNKLRRPSNAPGNLFVDESCIDCDTCRWMAPSTFARDSKSYVKNQPVDQKEQLLALSAAVACKYYSSHCTSRSAAEIRPPSRLQVRLAPFASRSRTHRRNRCILSRSILHFVRSLDRFPRVRSGARGLSQASRRRDNRECISSGLS